MGHHWTVAASAERSSTLLRLARGVAGLGSQVARAWRRAETCEQLEALTARRLDDIGGERMLPRRQSQVPVDGALMRRLMSLS